MTPRTTYLLPGEGARQQMRQRLIVRNIEALEPAERDYIVWDTDVPGFGLKVTPTGKRTFFLAYRTTAHTQRKPKIGDFPTLKPEAARRIAQDWAARVRAGGDPSRERMEERARESLGTLADLFEDYKAAKASMRSLDETARMFSKDVLPTLGKRRAEDITRADINRLLDKIAKRSQPVALRVRQALSAFYTWAMPRLPDGFSHPVKSAIPIAPPAARTRVLTDDEIQALWGAVEGLGEPWQTAVRLLILTGQRRSEVLEADWSEFDLEARLWTIPAARAKNGHAHLVPLSDAAVDLLRGLGRAGRVGVLTHKLCAATGTTIHEMRGAHWREFDLEAGTWTLPRRRAADGRRKVFTLPAELVEALRRAEFTGPLFPAANLNVNRAMKQMRAKVDEALGAPAAHWTLHDIRRTVATGLQRLGTRLEVTEAVLNHVSGSRRGIVGVYQRHDWLDEKQAALAAWARVVLPEATTGNVVPLRA